MQIKGKVNAAPTKDQQLKKQQEALEDPNNKARSAAIQAKIDQIKSQIANETSILEKNTSHKLPPPKLAQGPDKFKAHKAREAHTDPEQSKKNIDDLYSRIDALLDEQVQVDKVKPTTAS